MKSQDIIKLANILNNFNSRSNASQTKITFKDIVEEFYKKI